MLRCNAGGWYASKARPVAVSGGSTAPICMAQLLERKPWKYCTIVGPFSAQTERKIGAPSRLRSACIGACAACTTSTCASAAKPRCSAAGPRAKAPLLSRVSKPSRIRLTV